MLWQRLCGLDRKPLSAKATQTQNKNCTMKKTAIRGEIKRARFVGAALRTTERPGLETVPMIFAGVVNEDGRSVGFGSTVE